MALADTLAKAMSSEKYADARARIDSWLGRIRSGAKADAAHALREKNAYFASMRKQSPGLYSLLEADDRGLSQEGIRKLTGRDMIID